MNVLVIGSGGREHTLAWKLCESPSVSKVFWAPGNPATSKHPKLECRPIKQDDFAALIRLVKDENVELTVVGPEAPLVAGISDEFRKHKLRIFGPTKNGAQLEGSKIFSKKFFLKYGIPTGKATLFSDLKEALQFIKQHPKPLVVKADGLAAGKGVVVCQTEAEAETAVRDRMEKKIFGEAGSQILIEECLTGPEVSVHAITDGKSYKLLPTAQDHKRVWDNDQGPNTGGMGAYSPAPLLSDELEKRIREEVFDRTLSGLQKEGIEYCGTLYAGLMLTKDGPKMIEYNCRFGDPETQVIFTRLESDLAEVLKLTCDGRLNEIELKWKPESSVCVVLAAGGYPGEYPKGDVISGLEKTSSLPGTQVFHAGTTLQNSSVVTSGGRVLGVTALGSTLKQAIASAYKAVDLIEFKGKQYRTDIASKGFNS
jgi:phosphoribosylamine---glycine ligase